MKDHTSTNAPDPRHQVDVTEAVPAGKPIWTKQPDEVLEELQSSRESGLDPEDVRNRLAQFGPNELEDRGGKNPLKILWEQFTSTMVLILIAAAVLSGFLGKPLETAAIAAIVLLFAFLGFVQEYRAEKAMAALRQLAVPMVRVRRGGETTEISARELVPGDIVLLEAGNSLPADLRLLECANLKTQEAALTGESEAVEKQSKAIPNEELSVGDRVNMAYMGTHVSYGRGVGVVVATGMKTELGRIAELIQSVEQLQTPLQRQLDYVGKQLAVFGAAIALILLVVGVLRGEPVSDMILTAVSLAVAVVPEGLPAVVTVTLAVGAQRMLKRRALIRKLPAVETLGAVTIICSDKTGTLTQNRMTVVVVDVADFVLDLSDRSESAAALVESSPGSDEHPAPVDLTLAIGTLCNDASLSEDPETDGYLTIGDPTEGALLMAAREAGFDGTALKEALPRVGELPFDSGRKRMTTIHRLGESTTLPALDRLRDEGHQTVAFTKGSVDGLVELSASVWLDQGEAPLDESWKERILSANSKLAANGIRVLAVAMKPLAEMPEIAGENLERDLIFVGLVGMIDPPRAEARTAIELCRTAGIRPIMITGDHPLTARYIAQDLGIASDDQVKTGLELDMMDHDELSRAVEEVSVFARVTPEHKLRIVGALQGKNHVVAMTGDGVNDSPALRKSDIGVAMGITGTDVSKEAAQMVLLDDNFATIVSAVEEGRSIYDNIRRFVKFSIAGNVGKVIVMLMAPFAGINVALLPLQLLWLNLLTDGLLGVGLGMEAPSEGTMSRPPRKKEQRFIDRAMLHQITWIGILIGGLACATGYLYYRVGPDDRTWQTMVFTSLAFMQIGQALASRSNEQSLLTMGLRTNLTLLIIVPIVFGLQLAALYLPFLEAFFGIVPLSPRDLMIAVGLGAVVLIVIEIEKALRRRRAA